MAQYHTFKCMFSNTDGDTYHLDVWTGNEDDAIRYCIKKAGLLMSAKGGRDPEVPLLIWVSPTMMDQAISITHHARFVRVWSEEEAKAWAELGQSQRCALEVRLMVQITNDEGTNEWATRAKWTLSTKTGRRRMRRDI